VEHAIADGELLIEAKALVKLNHGYGPSTSRSRSEAHNSTLIAELGEMPGDEFLSVRLDR
jgi:hypothetical protein